MTIGNDVVGVRFFNERKFDKNFFLNLLNTKLLEFPSDLKEKDIFKELIKCIEDDEFVLNQQEINFIRQYPEKIIEYLIFRYKFRIYPEKNILTDFPLYLLIEPTSVCNLRCSMCFQTDSFFSEKNNMGFMDFEFYKDLINQAVEGSVKALTMASRGEPLLHKDFGKMLDYAKGKFFELKVNTNAMLLDEDMAHKLLASGVNDLVFSIDSADKAQYEKIRVGAKFDTVLENIKNFNNIRSQYYPESKTITRISGVKSSYEQDMELFQDFWSQYVDEVAYVNCIDRKDSYNNEISKADYPCKILWNRMYIWWNGVCNPCDFDYKSSLAIGSAKENSIKDIWLGEKFQNIRKLHLAANRDSCYPCNLCEL